MARYLYGQEGSTIGYMDSKDKYLYSTDGAAIAYWDSNHRYMYTPAGQTFGYIDSRGRYLYSQSGETVGYFHPPYATKCERLWLLIDCPGQVGYSRRALVAACLMIETL